MRSNPFKRHFWKHLDVGDAAAYAWSSVWGYSEFDLNSFGAPKMLSALLDRWNQIKEELFVYSKSNAKTLEVEVKLIQMTFWRFVVIMIHVFEPIAVCCWSDFHLLGCPSIKRTLPSWAGALPSSMRDGELLETDWTGRQAKHQHLPARASLRISVRLALSVCELEKDRLHSHFPAERWKNLSFWQEQSCVWRVREIAAVWGRLTHYVIGGFSVLRDVWSLVSSWIKSCTCSVCVLVPHVCERWCETPE